MKWHSLMVGNERRSRYCCNSEQGAAISNHVSKVAPHADYVIPSVNKNYNMITISKTDINDKSKTTYWKRTNNNVHRSYNLISDTV